jgi:hypothetical protein
MLIATTAADADKAAAKPPRFTPHHRTLFFAVFEGLYEDGLSNEDVDRILMPEQGTTQPMHFIYGCPICDPALDALRAYRARPKLHYKNLNNDSFGQGPDPAVSKALASDDFKTRFDAIQKLIQRWVSRRLDLMRLTAQERAQWALAIADMKKKGEAMLQAEVAAGRAGPRAQAKGCSICNGADAAMK